MDQEIWCLSWTPSLFDPPSLLAQAPGAARLSASQILPASFHPDSGTHSSLGAQLSGDREIPAESQPLLRVTAGEGDAGREANCEWTVNTVLRIFGECGTVFFNSLASSAIPGHASLPAAVAGLCPGRQLVDHRSQRARVLFPVAPGKSPSLPQGKAPTRWS